MKVPPRPTANTTSIAQRQRSAQLTSLTYPLVPASMPLFTWVKNQPCWPWLWLSSSNAASAGVSVRALKTESTTAKAMVSENCW